MISIGCEVPMTSARKKIIVAVYTIRRQKGISNLTDIFRKDSLYIGCKKNLEAEETFLRRERRARVKAEDTLDSPLRLSLILVAYFLSVWAFFWMVGDLGF